MAIQILFADRNLKVIGDPLMDWSSLDVTLKFNEPAAGTITMPAWPETMDSLQPGNRIIVIRDGVVWTTGPMEVVQDYTWSIDSADAQDPGQVSAHFTDDLAVIAGHITYIAPASVFTSQPITRDENETLGAAAYSNYSPTQLTRRLVLDNCGIDALADRRIPYLTCPATVSTADSVSIRTRYEPVLDACRRAVSAGATLTGFRTALASDWSSVEFQAYVPQDKTGPARFSRGLGNLRSVHFTYSAPTVTRAFIEGTYVEATTTAPVHVARQGRVQMTNSTNANAWWYVEKLETVSNETDPTTGLPTTDGSAVLNAAATALHTDNGPSVELATTTVDTEDLKAGRDFNLGDSVTIELPTGLFVAAVVREIQLTATPQGGEVVTSVIGTSDATSEPKLVGVVRELSRRLGTVEKRANVKK